MGLTQTPNMVSFKKTWPRGIWQLITNIGKFAFLGMVGFVLVIVPMMFLPNLPSEPTSVSSDPQPYAPLLVIILTYYLTVTLHELGHVIGGALMGFRFVLFGLGPLQIRREMRGIRLRFQVSVLALDGFAISVPTDDRDLKRRLAVMYAGGPLASLLQGVLVYLLLFIWQDSLWIASVPVFVPLWVWSVFAFVVSGLPLKISGFMTDGARLLTSVKGGQQAERMCMYYALAGHSFTGQRPRDLNPIWLQQALALSDNSAEEAHLNLLAYFHFLDKDEPNQAATYLDRALSLWYKIPPFFRARYFLEAAYYEATYAQDANVARTWLRRAKRGLLLEKHTRLRAEAAVLLAEDRVDAAQVQASRGLSLVDRTIDRGGTKAATDWLQEIVTVAHAG